MTVGLTGCEENNHPINYTDDDFIGTWNTNDGGKFIFYKNLTMYMEDPEGRSIDGTYKFLNGEIEIRSALSARVFKYKFINIDKIKLIYREEPQLDPLILTRQKI